MNTNNTFAGIVIVALLLGACVPRSTPTPNIPVTGAIGRISVEETLVESGPSDSLIQVTKTEDFFDNYAVRVTNGGVAKLDFFVDQISIRLFNDTAVGDVRADPSGTPDRAVRMKLVFGGLSGEVVKNGIPVKFEITNGVNIYILGTQFLVLFDPQTSTTYIGNFDGTIVYTIPGQPSSQFIEPGQIYEISQNFETTKLTLNFTRTDIENLTSNKRSTLLATLKDYLEPTSTPTATTTPTPSPTSSPTITSTPTPSPTLSPTITPTPTKITPCDKAAFVADVSIPDGTLFSPGFQFTKVWRLKNVGTCTWTTSYS
ncbi:MAG TPA: NBR1-Ig-like domain-containing protein, partial [Anaerolineales bacterium]|nr:NBR1-Ig-like domain-containing protein [Anaerolineales bacterium]